MKTLGKVNLILGLSLLLVSCAKNPGSGDDGDCGKCPTGTACNNGKCEALCNKDADCGKCSTCEASFCHKYADFCVIAVEPASGATGVDINTQTMKITFSSDLNPSSIGSSSVGLIKGESSPISSTTSVAGPVVTMKIGTLLSPASEYTIWVGQEVQSADMIFLPERFESKFTTITSDSGATGPAGFGLSPVAGHMEGGRYSLDVVGGPVAGTAEGNNASVTVSDGFWK